jgi:hypothetical protein
VAAGPDVGVGEAAGSALGVPGASVAVRTVAVGLDLGVRLAVAVMERSVVGERPGVAVSVSVSRAATVAVVVAVMVSLGVGDDTGARAFAWTVMTPRAGMLALSSSVPST